MVCRREGDLVHEPQSEPYRPIAIAPEHDEMQQEESAALQRRRLAPAAILVVACAPGTACGPRRRSGLRTGVGTDWLRELGGCCGHSFRFRSSGA